MKRPANINWKQHLQNPEMLLYIMAAAVPLSFATWRTLLNNFAIEQASFSGIEMGILQSLREVPGFLAFAVVFLLLLFREQTLVTLSLVLLGIGTAITGLLPSVMGLYFTTLLMSIGFHYAETLQQSLSLQLVSKDRLPVVMGRQMAVGSFTGLFVFTALYLLLDLLQVSYQSIYLLGGTGTAIMAVMIYRAFPHFKGEAEQHKKMILRRNYWLYYALTFLSGARRQIFVVFAGFLMVEKFNYSAADMSVLFLINGALTIYLAPRIGRLVIRWGEKKALTFEYLGLMVIFTGYALVENTTAAAFLYILDHVFFAMAIALKSYFKKIANPADFASTAGVAFSINHIAAVFLPFVLGFLWVVSPPMVFLTGTAFAFLSLSLSQFVPQRPEPGQETTFKVKTVTE
jgi:hypothetical protein